MTARRYPYKAWWIDGFEQKPVEITLSAPVVGTTDLDVGSKGKVFHIDTLFGTRDLALANALTKVEARMAELNRAADRLMGQRRRLRAHIKEGQPA